MRASRRTRGSKSALLAAAAALTTLLVVHAATSWIAPGSGNWTIAVNWSAGVPVAGSDVFINHADSTSRTITYNYTGASILFNSMTVNNFGTGSNTFSQPANTLNTSTET